MTDKRSKTCQRAEIDMIDMMVRFIILSHTRRRTCMPSSHVTWPMTSYRPDHDGLAGNRYRQLVNLSSRFA